MMRREKGEERWWCLKIEQAAGSLNDFKYDPKSHPRDSNLRAKGQERRDVLKAWR